MKKRRILKGADKEHVVVSMASFPPAIPYAVKAVKSLLAGSMLPDKIVIYLTLAQFPDSKIPPELTELTETHPIVEVRDYPVDIRSYRKLVPALKDFPDSVIVTVDDDIRYHPDMLSQLLEIHRQYPEDVIAHRAKLIRPGYPYKKWRKFRWYHFLNKRIHRNPLVMQTGVAGVLYPPGSVRADMMKEEKFQELAPTTDDIWFWAATVLNGRNVIPVPFGKNKPKEVGKPKSLSLKTINFKSGEDKNLEALNKILGAFPELKNIIEKPQK